MAKVMLRTFGLTKKYGEFAALSDVSLTLRQGDIYGLVGRNGAGKTTFFKCVMGLATPTAGEVEIDGEKTDLNSARREIGFMISSSFFSYLNPKQSLEYLCRIKNVPRKGEVDRLLEIVGLGGVKKPFKTFSMGMKQRLGLAGAMLGSPAVVVLDEPINGLDPQGIADMREIIRRENKENGTTFIVSSHILSELDLVATTFGFIEQGRLVREITHTDLHEHTKKSLIIGVDDGEKAKSILKDKFDIEATTEGNRLTLESQLEKAGAINRALVAAGTEVYQIFPRETTLEEYFMKLIGGGENV